MRRRLSWTLSSDSHRWYLPSLNNHDFCIYHSNEGAKKLVSQDRPRGCALQKQSRHLVAFYSVRPLPQVLSQVIISQHHYCSNVSLSVLECFRLDDFKRGVTSQPWWNAPRRARRRWLHSQPSIESIVFVSVLNLSSKVAAMQLDALIDEGTSPNCSFTATLFKEQMLRTLGRAIGRDLLV